MLKKNKIRYWITTIIMIIFLPSTTCVLAADNGGSVQTKGIISFYNDQTQNSSVADQTDNQEEMKIYNKKTILPQTGEITEWNMQMLGISLLILSSMIFFMNSKNQLKKGRK